MSPTDPQEKRLFAMPDDQEQLSLEQEDELEVPDGVEGEDSDPFLADLDTVISRMFSVWSRGSEPEWVAHAWRVLRTRGLTECATLVERARVLCRLGALAAVYQETCARYLGDGSSGEWTSRVQELLGEEYPYLREFSLGLLAAEEGIGAEDSSGPDWEEISVAKYLTALVEGEYRSVADTLLAEWGASEITATIVHSARFDAEFPLSAEVRGDILDDVTADLMSAYQWINDGMPLWG